MTPWPPHDFLRVGKSAGCSDDLLANSVVQAHRPQMLGRPAILTLNHLAVQTDVPFHVLRRIVGRSFDHAYRFTQISKRSGGKRLICMPHNQLLKVQKWLARYVLQPQQVHPASFAYVKGKKAPMMEAARMHCGCRWLIKLDVQQFFESISERQVYHVFRSLGYEPLVSFELARICTRIGVNQNSSRYRRRRWRRRRRAGSTKIREYYNRLVGHLPQGAPTSPALSNLVMRLFDERVAESVAKRGLTYTRYADDIALSTSSSTFTRNDAMVAIKEVFTEMRAVGLRPHTAKKILIAPPGSRKVVLGMLVDGNQPRLTREFRKRLEQHLHGLHKFGIVCHATTRGFKSVFAMKSHIAGLIAYAAQVEPSLGARYATSFNKLSWGASTDEEISA